MRKILFSLSLLVLAACGSSVQNAGVIAARAILGSHAAYSNGSERVLMDASVYGFQYAYAPTMVRTGQRTLAWACTMRSTGGDVIRLTYSDDRVNWAAPGIVLTHASAPNFPFACDPAVVFFNGYYYLFWGGADLHYGGFIALSRSPLSNPAGFQNYIGGDPNSPASWRAGDGVVPAALLKPAVSCTSGASTSCYGVGQPTVVLKDGLFHMWFTDTTAPNASGIWYTTSSDGVNWTPRVFTGVYGASVDVKWDVATGSYFMFELLGHGPSPTLQVRSSTDAVHWSAPQFLGTAPNFSNNVGVEGTPEGFIDSRQGSLLVGYGAPYGLAPTDNWGHWNLYGGFVQLGNVPPPPPTPTPLVESASTVAMRRFYAPGNGDHLLTTSPSENPPGYNFEGSPFRVYTSGGAGRVALYRCYVPAWADHFASLEAGCERQNAEGIYGYLGTSGTPVYRCFKGTHHLITTDPAECTRNAFAIEGILGYAP